MLNQCEISFEHHWHGFLWSSSQFFTIRDKKALVALFAKMSLSLRRICQKKLQQTDRIFIDSGFFVGDALKRFVCYFLGVSFVEDLFQLFSVTCVKPLFLC